MERLVVTEQISEKESSGRIQVVDVLRGIAIAGIVMIHFIEHLNFYVFPEPGGPLMEKIDAAVWDTVFFLLAGKMYAIFSLLFGFSFFIQFLNAARKGYDFSGRFAWRMVLLMLLGLFDLCFYNGDILFVYAVCGMIIVPAFKTSDKFLFSAALFFLFQPIELGYLIGGLIDPTLQPMDLDSNSLFGAIVPSQMEGGISDVAYAGLRYGLMVNFTWALEHGRFTQTLGLFLLGIYLGRKSFFIEKKGNSVTWKKLLLGGTAGFFFFWISSSLIPETIENQCVRNSLNIMLEMWKNFSMMLMIVSGVLLLFYQTRFQNGLLKIAPYGKMSLTNYLGQSIFGSLIFYNWGFGWYQHLGHTSSLLLGIIFICLQYIFCKWWLLSHKRGPFEELWSRGTKLNFPFLSTSKV